MVAVGPWASNERAQTIRTYAQFASPLVLLLVFLMSFVAYSILTTPKIEDVKSRPLGPGGKPLPRNLSPSAKAKRKEKAADFSPAWKTLFNCLSLAVILTFVGSATLTIIHALLRRADNWWCGQSTVVYVVASFFVYTLVEITIVDTERSPSPYHALTWLLGLLTEFLLIGSAVAIYTSPHREPKAGSPDGGKLRTRVTTWEAVEILLDLIRIVCLAALIFFYALSYLLRTRRTQHHHKTNGHAEESTGLLNGHGHQNGSTGVQGYGSRNEHQKSEEPAGWVRPKTNPKKSWWEYARAYALFLPYLWPSKSRRLQFLLVICCILVGLTRIVNVLVPIQAGKITDILSGENGVPPAIPWLQILLYICFRFLQGNSGVLATLREYLFIPVSQYCFRELSVASFEHVHNLSLEFHLGKRTGEVLSALNKGQSINTFLGQVTFQFVPMIADLGVAVGYFLIEFDVYYSLVVALVAFTYVYVTIRMAQWRGDIRREMNNLDRASEAVKNDSMVSYETVKYFNAEPYEFNRYRDAIRKFQRVEYINTSSLNLMNLSQNLCFMIGLLITCFIAAFQVATGQRKVGKFVALLTYMAQLQGPLNFLGTFYRSIQASMINAERLLELFKEQPTVVDKPDAKEIQNCDGKIMFKDVNFSYDPRKPALNGLDFECTPGTTTALVGESGGGKSTVFRLLFRFYNIGSGSISIDGHNIEDLTIESVRRHIGVVPQDTVLFNESLMYNLRYANQKATDEEIYEACRAASIHDQILSFPDGYNSKVGERGLKLSGGEKQRIAIARTILKGPRVILLDEATAALDTETEQHIEYALDKLSAQRTSLVIAHRLSTITSADQIVVIHSGQVAEKGTHEELLALKGRYASMWRKQIKAQKAAQEAKVASDRAKQLRHQAQGDESATQSEDERSEGKSRARTPPEYPVPGGNDDDGSGPVLPPGHP